MRGLDVVSLRLDRNERCCVAGAQGPANKIAAAALRPPSRRATRRSSVPGVTGDPERTAVRRGRLEEYMREHVLGERFCCRHHDDCRASATRRPGVSFYAGQLSYVGRHYDTEVDGRPFRVLVVPMETGRERERVTISQRELEVTDRIGQPFWQRNPHMRGTTLALRLAFGLGIGDDLAGERLPGSGAHVFEAFAMANLLLCSAVKTGTTTSRQTALMRRNCSKHLAATIQVLEPTLVISQGAPLVKPLSRLFTTVEEHSPIVRTVALQGRKFLWVLLHHPSSWSDSNWSRPHAPYLRETVVPAIELARSLTLGHV